MVIFPPHYVYFHQFLSFTPRHLSMVIFPPSFLVQVQFHPVLPASSPLQSV
jgi:hypothetical protein